MQEKSLTPVDDRSVINIEEYAMTAEKLVAQVRMIQDVMKAVMKKDEHYGVIPGCGPKPTLLKPGAEKLATTFRLGPKYSVDITDMTNGHRDYLVNVTLIHIPTGAFVGEGVGSCSTTENKYRFRWENTGEPVPQAYWEARDTALLGGVQYAVRKIKGKWIIHEKVEHDNPSDYFNTCLKMAKKRALVDAVLTATAASDIFTQDVEDLPEYKKDDAPEGKPSAERKKTAPRNTASHQKPPPSDSDVASPAHTPTPTGTPQDEEMEQKVRDGFMKQIGKALGKVGLDHSEVKEWLAKTNTFKGQMGEMFGHPSWRATNLNVLGVIVEKLDLWLPLAIGDLVESAPDSPEEEQAPVGEMP